LVKGYPRLSETFIAQELLGLERRGLDLLIVSLRRPTDPTVHDLHRAIRADVLYLPEYLHDEPWRVLRSLVMALPRPGWWVALCLWLRDLVRDPTTNRIRRFGQATVLAVEMPADVRHLHVHYLHTPGSVGRYAATMLGRAYSLSAHAKDIWTIPDWEKREKLRDASWCVTCTRGGLEHLRGLAPDARVELVHHGLDLDWFAAPEASRNEPGTILCVARAVAKKGLDTLLEALALLPPDLDWRFEHIGGGQLTEALACQAERLGIATRVRWRGACDRAAVLAAYRRARLFCLPARIAPDGDRDGIPNVVVEAMSQALPVVATPVGAIAEVVRDGRTGLLVPPDDPPALAAAIERLLRDTDLADGLGAAGRALVERDLPMDRGLDRIATLLHDALVEPAAVPCGSLSTLR
jgi:glycosyltransferase involved in cell wall biosynthesis